MENNIKNNIIFYIYAMQNFMQSKEIKNG